MTFTVVYGKNVLPRVVADEERRLESPLQNRL